jgi:hypothetical protein
MIRIAKQETQQFLTIRGKRVPIHGRSGEPKSRNDNAITEGWPEQVRWKVEQFKAAVDALEKPKGGNAGALLRRAMPAAMQQAYGRLVAFLREYNGQPTKAQIADFRDKLEAEGAEATQGQPMLTQQVGHNKMPLDKIKQWASQEAAYKANRAIFNAVTTIGQYGEQP